MGLSFSKVPLSPLEYLPEDILVQILLHVPPHPCFLLRASLICKTFYRLINDDNFIKTYCAIHNPPPLLGLFHNEEFYSGRFHPIPVDSVSSVNINVFDLNQEEYSVIDSRHGLVLLQSINRSKFMVWDLVTGRKKYIRVPLTYHFDYIFSTASVVSTLPNGVVTETQFRIMLAAFDTEEMSTSVYIYFSEDKEWHYAGLSEQSIIQEREPSVLVRDVIYWKEVSGRIIAFNWVEKEISEIDEPQDPEHFSKSNLVLLEDARLGLAAVKNYSMGIHLWALQASTTTTAEQWVLHNIVELGRCLPIMASPIQVVGRDEESKVVFVKMFAELFSLELKSMKCTKLLDVNNISGSIYPYRRFFVKGKNIGDIIRSAGIKRTRKR